MSSKDQKKNRHWRPTKCKLESRTSFRVRIRRGASGCVGQVEVVVTPSPDRSDPVGLEEKVTTGGERVEEEFSSEDEDNMPSTTRLKYSRFKGDGGQDVDDWLIEFKSTALANQEELAAKQRIFQGVLKGKALKWYQDVPDRIRDN